MTRLLVALLFLAIAAPASAADTGASRPSSAARGERRTKKSKSQKPQKKAAPDPNHPVNITSQFFEVLPDSHQAQWRGNVVIERDGVRVTCDTMTATQDEAKRLDKLTCQGTPKNPVHMIQPPTAPGGMDREVWGELAVFENATGILTVTGNPRAREGDNRMRGTKVIFRVQENQLLVTDAVMDIVSAGEQGSATQSPAAPAPGAKVEGGAK